jgi:L-amino acid N-acyltransferase YncA
MNNISVRINNTDTQDNANGLYIRILEADEITDIYNEHIVTDFPASEVKPLSQMLRKREQGQYFVYGMFEDNGELAGYAYFIKCSNKDVYLLDYLAIVKNKRSKHLGSTFLQELKPILLII